MNEFPSIYGKFGRKIIRTMMCAFIGVSIDSRIEFLTIILQIFAGEFSDVPDLSFLWSDAFSHSSREAAESTELEIST